MKVIRALFFFTFITSNAQIEFQENVIIDHTYSADGSNSVYSDDIDGDGDYDILTASRDDHKIIWYENLDGQGNFSLPKVITLDAQGAISVITADVDNDGDVDVLAASFDGDKVTWYENLDGLGTFSTQHIIVEHENGVSDIYAEDIDGDGDIDVISVSSSPTDLGHNVSWYENTDGSGNFGPQQIIDTSVDRARSVFATDIDGDGDIDVLAASSDNDDINWYKNTDGLGDFVKQSINSDFNAAWSVSAGDIDGDGDVDVLASSADAKIIWHENSDGLGNFNSQDLIESATSTGLSILTTLLVDIDGDGDLDVLSALNGGYIYDGKVMWYENLDGQGNFGIAQDINTDSRGIESVYAEDIDGDGDKDVLFAADSNHHKIDKVVWYENTSGLGEFTFGAHLTSHIDYPSAISINDLNSDGNNDVIVNASLGDRISWFSNIDGLGGFDGMQQNIIDTNVSLQSIYALHSSDIDGDAWIDIVIISYGSINWYKNLDGQGNFSERRLISDEIDRGWSVSSTDIDNDGDLDIISGSYDDGKVAWYENTDGLGNFSSQQIINANTPSNKVFKVESADVDNDGDQDVVADMLNGIVWFENINGLGNFNNQPNVISGSNETRNMSLVDIDDDGDKDIIYVHSTSFVRLLWRENLDGLGNFGTENQIGNNYNNPSSNYVTFNVADIDNDDDLDVVYCKSALNQLSWYENIDGLGNFSSAEQIITSDLDSPVMTTSSDLDNDGDIDLISGSTDDDKVVWYNNLTTNLTVDENFATKDLIVYPNPVRSFLNISTEKKLRKIAVNNIHGQTLLLADSTDTINISSLSSGIYVLKIEDVNGQITVKRIIKQ